MITQFTVKNEEDILMASAIKWCPGLRPHRVVLRKIDDSKYVTHMETMTLETDTGDFAHVGTWVHESYNHGNYFGFPGGDDDLYYRAAFEDFESRCKKF